MLAQLSALVLGIGGTDSGVPPCVLLNIRPENHEPLAVLLRDGIEQLAQIKNVALQPGVIAPLAYWAMESIDLPTLAELPQGDPQAGLRVAALLNGILDILAASRFLHALWRFEGFEDIDLKALMPLAEAWMRERAANDVRDTRLRWPDPFETVMAYYRGRSRAGVSVQYPTGVPVRASLFLDRDIFRRLRKMPLEPVNTLVPLLVRCPGLPGQYLPDGKQTLRLPGVTACGWWRGGKLHRDPSEGPALHRIEKDREHIEYCVDGERHRGPADGPALIQTNADFEGLKVRCEEFHVRGKLHRPAEEGPAALFTDRQGKPVRESYYEHGVCHRPSQQGPAWSGLEDGKYIEAYLTHGRNHRSEAEGPAVTMRDPASGRVISEEYFSDGKRHRVGGPALITYGEDGTPLTEVWERDGVMHRDPVEGPAAVWRCEIETRTEFFVDGRCHRDPAEGPARIVRTAAGELAEIGYWVNGGQVRRYRSKRLRRAIRRSVQRSTRDHARACRRNAKATAGCAVQDLAREGGTA